jgi:hypothetical protein
MVAEWLLTRISQKSTLSEGGFLKLYEPLVSSIWHSGGLHRGKNRIARQAQAFQSALRSLDDLGSQSVREVFDLKRSVVPVWSATTPNDITEPRSVANGELPAASIRGATPFSGGRSSAPLRLPSGGSEFKAYQVYEH